MGNKQGKVDKRSGKNNLERPRSDPEVNRSTTDNVASRQKIKGSRPRPVSTGQLDEQVHMDVPENRESSGFLRLCDQLLQIQGDFRPLRSVKYQQLPPEGGQALQRLMNAYLSQHQQIQSLFRDLDDEREHSKQTLRGRDHVIDSLKRDIGLLKGEMRKRGLDPNSIPDEPIRDEDLRDSDPEDSREPKKKVRGLPTPIAQIEPKQGKEVLVRRGTSLRPVGSSSPPSSPRGVEDRALQAQVRVLQQSLQQERDRANDYEQRLRSRSSGSYESTEQRVKDHSVIAEKYMRLYETAMEQIYKVLAAAVPDASNYKLHRFICSAMEVAFDQAALVLRSMQQLVYTSLNNPVEAGHGGDSRGLLRADSGAGSPRGARKYEAGRPSYLARRTLERTEVPSSLTEQVSMFLETMSDRANIDKLTEEVIERLCRDHAQVTSSPAVIKSPAVTSWLGDVCRLAWRLATRTPPLQLQADADDRLYDSQLHVTASQIPPVGSAALDYFVWPVLLARNREVLVKGRVFVQTTM